MHPHVQMHIFPSLSTERAGNSNAPLTRSTVSPRSWFLNAILGSKGKKKKKCLGFFLLGDMARLGKELAYLKIPFKCQKVKKNLRKRRAYLKVKGATSRAPNGQIWDNLSRKINSNKL